MQVVKKSGIKKWWVKLLRKIQKSKKPGRFAEVKTTTFSTTYHLT
jgi:hypothetical protein